MPADYANIRELTSVNFGRGLLAARFDPTGTSFAVGGMNAQISRLTFADGKFSTPVHADGHASWVGTLAWHPLGRYVFAGDYGGNLLAWDFQGETPVLVWKQSAHQGWIRAAAVSPDGRYVASAGNDKTVRLWSSMDARRALEFTGHAEHVYSLAFHPTEPILVSGDLKGNLKQWSLESGLLMRELLVKDLFVQQQQLRLGGVRSLAFNKNGDRLVCGGMSGFGSIGDGIGTPTVFVLDFATGEPLQTGYPKEAARTFVMGAAVHHDGFILAATGGLDRGYFLVWKLGQTEKEAVFQMKLPESAWSMDLNPAQDRILTAHHDGHLRLHELPSAPAG